MLNTYPLQVEFNPDTHSYTTENGQLLISVTQILKIQGISPSFEGVPVEVLRKAAERGTAIHAEFEEIIKTKGDCVIFSDEAAWFLNNLYDQQDEWHSELLVYCLNLPLHYAGTIDIVRITADGKIQIYDIKTGKVHLDSVAWQLTLYAYAFAERYELDVNKIELFCIDAKEEGCRVISIHKVNEDEVMRLLQAQADGIPYTTGDIVLSQSNLARIEEFENYLKSIEAQKKDVVQRYELFQQTLMEAMLNNGVKSLETPTFKVTYVAESTSMNFDSSKFKADHEDLYEQYKTKPVVRKAYLKVTAK